MVQRRRCLLSIALVSKATTWPRAAAWRTSSWLVVNRIELLSSLNLVSQVAALPFLV